MNRSLQRHLSLVSGSVILLAGLIAAVASFGLAFSDAREFQDDVLRQIAKLSAVKTAPSLAQPPASSNGRITDPESLVSIYYLPDANAPAWLNRDLSAGLHTLDTGSGELRVFVRDGKNGLRTVVSQPTEVRDEIAINSAVRTLIPLLLLLPILVWLITYVVRNELAPIKRLSRSMDEQPVENPRAIADNDLPQEITPFVHAINRLLERVNRLMQQQRRFVADAAHELRSPLTALSLQAQNLKSAGTLEAVRERVVPLQEGIERARLLTEQLLSLARTQSGERVDSDIDVSAMARELIADYLPLAEAKGIDLGIEEFAHLYLHTEPEPLRMIIKNALDNAIKYTLAHGKVTLRLVEDNNNSVIEIVDSGPGIAVQESERVFDPFYRVQDTSVAGSGLGLAIAKEAAIRLGGTISLHQVRNGSGLIFRFTKSINSVLDKVTFDR
jgi:two-component system, OmpR family, sensor kinase